MTSVDTKVDLIINRLSKEQYDILEQQKLIDDNQLYMIPDENPLDGKTYDFSSNESIYEALGDLIVALGGNVINMPEKE